MMDKAVYRPIRNGHDYKKHKLLYPVVCPKCGELRYVLKKDLKKAARRLCRVCYENCEAQNG